MDSSIRILAEKPKLQGEDLLNCWVNANFLMSNRDHFQYLSLGIPPRCFVFSRHLHRQQIHVRGRGDHKIKVIQTEIVCSVVAMSPKYSLRRESIMKCH
jgi:hypothetical protein